MSKEDMKQKNVFVRQFADVASGDNGANTRIWQFVVIRQGAKFDVDCNICAHFLIEGDVAIGDRVVE